MSNLGDYQRMTTWSKKVGGPVNLLGLAVGSGVLIGGLVVHFGSGFYEKIISKNNNEIKDPVVNAKTFEVTTANNEIFELSFEVGDEFKVIETDGETVLITKIDGENEPIYVSKDFLKGVSLPYLEYLENKLID